VTGPASTGEVAVSEILFQSLKDYKMNEFAMETGFSSPGKSVVGDRPLPITPRSRAKKKASRITRDALAKEEFQNARCSANCRKRGLPIVCWMTPRLPSGGIVGGPT
jgi:hypothetical protein